MVYLWCLFLSNWNYSSEAVVSIVYTPGKLLCWNSNPQGEGMRS
jgi:hypothetical protein